MIAHMDRRQCREWLEEHHAKIAPVVAHCAQRVEHDAEAQQELAGALWLGVVERCPGYRSERATPQTYARVVCQSKVQSIQRRDAALKRGAARTRPFAALQEPGARPFETTVPDGHRPQDRLRGRRAPQEQRAMQLDVSAVLASLPPGAQAVAQHLAELTPEEAQAFRDRASPEVQRQLCDIARRFAAAELDAYL